MSLKIRIDPTQKYNIVGVNGQGKSVLFQYLIKCLVKEGVRVYIYDTEKQYQHIDPNLPSSLRIYTPKNPGDSTEFDNFLKIIYERQEDRTNEGYKVTPRFIAVESIDFYAPPKADLQPYLKKVIHWGRMKKIGLLTTSRRPADVHKDVCGLAKGWALFHIYIENDIKWLRRFVGPQVAESLITLEPYKFYWWEKGRAELMNPVPYEEAQL
jgi:hypothetical protein